MSKVRREIGQRLKKCRMECGLTQQKLSEQVGLQTKSYSNIETGQTLFSVEVLLRLTEVLNVSADYILHGYVQSVSPLNQLLEKMKPSDLERIEQIIKIYYEAVNETSG